MRNKKDFAEIYDLVIARSKLSDDKINNNLSTILKENKIKKVWDNACGTGRQAIFLSNKGYEILASDINSYFIKKLKNNKKINTLRLEVRDMKKPQNEKFDCILSMFNSICHLSKSELSLALRNWKISLNKEGLLIFDIFNEKKFLKDLPNYKFIQRAIEIENKKIISFNQTRYNPKNKILKSNLETYLQEGLKKPIFKKIVIKQRIYSIEEIKVLLADEGFTIQQIIEPKGKKFSQENSLFALFIAKSI